MIITNLLREGDGAKPKARKKSLALNQVITSECPMDPMGMRSQKTEKS